MLIILIKARFYTEVSKTKQANFRLKMLKFYKKEEENKNSVDED